MTTREIIKARIAGITKEMLLEIAESLNTKLDSESILVCGMVETELEARMTEAEFTTFMEKQNLALDNA